MMASGGLSFTFFLLFFTISSPSSSISLPSVSFSSKKVSLGLYYETLCPFSAKFIINDFAKIFHNGLIDIVDLNLVPWGNAKLGKNNTFNCQHGPTECLLNTIEACAIHVWPDVEEHFPFIYCIETFVYEHGYGQWETCFEKLNLDPKPVTNCYGSGLGDKLELQYAAETNALEPRHTYVPWLVVDGQPLYDDYTDFISYICKAYKRNTLPKACSESSLRTPTEEEKANGNNPVCYTVIKTTLSRLRSAIASWIRQDNVAASI